MLKNIIIIIVIIAAVFLSQMAFFRPYGKDAYDRGMAECQTYWQKAHDYIQANIIPKISGEVGKRKDLITNEIEKEKNNFLKNISQQIKNYFLNLFSDIFNSATGAK